MQHTQKRERKQRRSSDEIRVDKNQKKVQCVITTTITQAETKTRIKYGRIVYQTIKDSLAIFDGIYSFTVHHHHFSWISTTDQDMQIIQLIRSLPFLIWY